MHHKVILIIDDSESDQFITKHSLEKTYDGIEVHSAFDGQEALDILDQGTVNPDVIFLDINMPGMNGFKFLEQYSIQYGSPVIVMLTSSDQDQDIEYAKQYKCVVKYCVKPLDTHDVVELI